MTTKTIHRMIGQITKGKHKGALVRPCHDSMDCPYFSGANDEHISICYICDNGEQGLIIALRDSEVRWF